MLSAAAVDAVMIVAGDELAVFIIGIPERPSVVDVSQVAAFICRTAGGVEGIAVFIIGVDAVFKQGVAVGVQRFHLVSLRLDDTLIQHRIDGPLNPGVARHVERRDRRPVPGAVNIAVNGRVAGKPHAAAAGDGVPEHLAAFRDLKLHPDISGQIAVLSGTLNPDRFRGRTVPVKADPKGRAAVGTRNGRRFNRLPAAAGVFERKNRADRQVAVADLRQAVAQIVPNGRGFLPGDIVDPRLQGRGRTRNIAGALQTRQGRIQSHIGAMVVGSRLDIRG
jgi:hypothetical protein